MVDVPTTTAVTPATLPAAAVTAVAPVEATVTSVPDKIQQLARQIQVNATVAQAPSDGTVILNSVVGPLTILLPQLADAQQQKLLQQLIALTQSQRPLTVAIQPGNPPTQAFLFLPPSGNAAPTAAATTPQDTINTVINQSTYQPRVTVIPGTILSAVVLPPNVSPQTNTVTQQAVPTYVPSALPTSASVIPAALAPAAAALSSITENLAPTLVNTPAFQELAAKTEITSGQNVSPQLPLAQQPATDKAPIAQPVSLQSVQQPTAPASIPITPSQTTILSPPPIPLPTQLTLAASALNPLLTADALNVPTFPIAATVSPAAGSEVRLQIDAVIPPLTAANVGSLVLNLPTPGANQVLATITSLGPTGQALLQVGDATLYIKQPVDLPIGTNLLLTVEAAKTPAMQTLPIPDTQNFSNLQIAIDALNQINPQLAQQVLNNHIPQPSAALPGSLLFFMSALKQSSVRTWLGDDAVDALNRTGRFELLNKLAQDLGRSGQDVNDPVVGDWKSYPIPLHNNNQFQIVNFYVHGDGGRQDGTSSLEAVSKRKNTRFVIDVRMSQLGPMQLDGFIQLRKLDIMVRSEHVLPEGLHSELRKVYTNALSGIDYAGSLNFQVGRHHWLIIQNAKGQAKITT